MKRRFFTLIEMMVALVFLSMLLSTLFFWYRSITFGKKEADVLSHRDKELVYLDYQLSKIIPNTTEDHFFTLGDSTLVFTFDYGAQIEPLLSNTVLGRLYLDPQTKDLCIGIWPKPETKKREPFQTRLLMENVDALSFEFYWPPNPFKLGVDPEEVGKVKPLMGWQQVWKDEFHVLPPMMKVTLTKNNKITVFTFDLRHAKQPIVLGAS